MGNKIQGDVRCYSEAIGFVDGVFFFSRGVFRTLNVFKD